MHKLSILAAFALFSAPIAAQDAVTPTAPVAALPSWMAGAWVMQDGANWADEFWTNPRGGMMIGSGRTGFGPDLKSWESMRIVRKADGSISFFAQPQGAPASEFPMERMSEQAIDFANPAHDYPQRIRYWRQGQLLMAEISKEDGSQAVRFHFRPMGE